MTTKKTLSLSVLSALVGVSVAAAQPGHDGHFAKLDTNGDGVVTTAELEAGALARFTKADANQDGEVTRDEASAARTRHQKERFAARDQNGNGQLERSEVERMPDAWFARIDTDQSGALSQAELEAGRPFKHARVGKDHANGPKDLPGDADRDGVLTKAEAVSGAQSLAKKLDQNGDGKLTKDELGRFHHRGGHGHSNAGA